MRVRLFPTCLAELVRPQAARCAEKVLRDGGCDVEVPRGAVCCGQPAWNSGHVEAARRVAAGTLRALAGEEQVVVCSGSCSTMMHEYWPQLFAGTDLEDAALKTSQQVSEFSSFVADKFGPELFSGARTTGDGVAVYHDSCHMMRVLGIRDAPRRLLAYVKNLDVRELEAPERCCGFGGTFSLRYPELASAMADEKVDDATAQGASVLVSSDIGCLMHICGRAGSRGTPLDGRYIAEMLVDERNP